MSATFRGVVTKVGAMNKTATVSVERLVMHKRTRKMLTRSKKFLTHDEENVLRRDDVVVIRQCAPVSKRKRWTIDNVVRSPENASREARELVARANELARARQAAERLEQLELARRENDASGRVIRAAVAMQDEQARRRAQAAAASENA